MKRAACSLERSRIAVIAGTALFAVLGISACGTGGNADKALPTAAGVPNSLPEDPRAALETSARLLANATSARTEFTWDIERDSFHIRGSGDFGTKVASGLHLDVHYRGDGRVPQPFDEANDSKLIVVGAQTYIRTPPLGDAWVLFTPAELGPDWDVLQRLLARRAAFDYGSVVTAEMRELSESGRGKIGDAEYQLYEFGVDAGVLMNALADAYGAQGAVMLANRFSGYIPAMIWLDPATLKPRRLSASGRFSFLGKETHLQLEVNFLELDSFNSLPNAPANAVPVRR